MTGTLTLTITPAALHAALTEVETIGRTQGTAAYAGGIAALRSLFAPPPAAAVVSVADQVRRAFEPAPEPLPAPKSATAFTLNFRRTREQETCTSCGCLIEAVQQYVVTSDGKAFCLPCSESRLGEPTADAAPRAALDTLPAPTLAPPAAPPTHADSLPAAAPPLTIPPLPAGPGYASDIAGRAPAAEAAAQPLAPAPAPPPVLAPEGISAPRQKRGRQGERPSLTWSPERIALAKARYPTEGASPALLAALNALEGPEITLTALKGQVKRMRLSMTPEAYSRMLRERAVEARATLAAKRSAAQPPSVTPPNVETEAPTEAPAPAPEPEPPAAPEAPAAPPPGPTASSLATPIQPGDEKAEAFDYFNAGKSVRDVMQDFRVDAMTANGWQAEWKRAPRVGAA